MSDLSPFVQRLREAVLLSSVIGQYIPIKRHGHEYQACCPFHNEKTPSFTMNDQKGFYHCFGCGAHGDIVRFMMDYHHLPFLEAVTQLADSAGLSVPPLQKLSHNIHSNTDSSSHKEKQYAIMEDACTFFQQTLQTHSQALSYLKERGCDETIMTRFRLGFGTQNLVSFLEKKQYPHSLMEETGLILKKEEGKGRTLARFRNRIMIPIMDHRGRIIAFGGRLWDHETDSHQNLAKYMNSPQTVLFNKSHVLFGLSTMARPSKDNPLVVVEGYFDVIMAQKNGFNAVAPLGTALTTEHLQKLWKQSFEPVLCFDGDGAGKKAMHRALFHAMAHLKPGYTLRCASLPKGEDPDSLLRSPHQGRALFNQYIQNAKPLFEVLCEAYHEAVSQGAPEIKAMRKKEFIRLIDTIPDDDVKEFYKQEFFQKIRDIASHTTSPRGHPLQKHNASFLKNMKVHDRVNKTPLHIDQADVVMQKILLVTLLNHPTLIAQMSEYIVQAHFSLEGAKDVIQEMMNYAMHENNKTENDLKEKVNDSWKSMLAHILLREENATLAPFSSKTASNEDAEVGFMDVWHRYILKKNLEHDLSMYQTHLKKAWDPFTWQALQQTHKDLQSFLATKE